MAKFKLLGKRDIDAAKQREQQTHVNEGRKLAASVDNLRELRANEEQGLEQYRVKALAAIQAEIDPKIVESARLDTEIRTKKAERERLSKPLDEAWAVLKAEKAKVEQREEGVAVREGELKLAIAANIRRERENTVEEARIADDRQTTSEALVAAQKLHTQAKTINSDARQKSAIINAALDLREKEADKREQAAAKKEADADARQKRMDAYEKKLFMREQLLKTGWQDFIRTKNNHGQPRNSNPVDPTRRTKKGR